MRWFRVTFEVNDSKLETIVGLLSKEVNNLNIQATDTTKGTARVATVPRATRGISPMSQTKMGIALLKGLNGRRTEFSTAEAGEIVVEAGFSASSASSCLTALVREGLVRRVDGKLARFVMPTEEA